MHSILLVGAQFTLLLLIAAPWPSAIVEWHRLAIIGILFCIDALVIALWAMYSLSRKNFSVLPEPVSSGELCKAGPYKWVRHPMYSAVILGATGFCLVYMQALKWILLLLLVFVLLLKIRKEEHLLQVSYPSYAAYQKGSKALIPWVY